jgi:hypothetical protein
VIAAPVPVGGVGPGVTAADADWWRAEGRT